MKTEFTRQPFTELNRAVRLHTYEVKHLFCKVDAEYAKLLFHGTRLLLVHDFSRLLKSLWLMGAVPHRGGSISWIETDCRHATPPEDALSLLAKEGTR